MKKIILTAVLAAFVAAAATAQPRAIGLRAGWGAEASYQHTLGDINFIEADLGLYTVNSLNLAVTYNFMIAQPNWTDRGEWGFYAGPGAALGTKILEDNSSFYLAVAGQAGLEYTFWFPLQLSADIRPQFGFAFGDNAFYGEALSFVPTLSVRYRF